MLISGIALLTSCNHVQGIKKVNNPHADDLKHFFSKNSLELNQFFIDSTYKSHLLKTPTHDKHILKNHLQPLQCIYFDSLGFPIAYFINCYADPGLLRLKWNNQNQFEHFPPKGNAPLDTLLHRDALLKLIQPLKTGDQLPPLKRYTVAILWNRTFNRYSRDLIRLIQKNTHKRKDVNLIYINNDLYLNSLSK